MGFPGEKEKRGGKPGNHRGLEWKAKKPAKRSEAIEIDDGYAGRTTSHRLPRRLRSCCSLAAPRVATAVAIFENFLKFNKYL